MTDRITEIHIRFRPQVEQRYATLGDWQILGDTLNITITQMPRQEYSWPIAVHELIEALLCHQKDITSDQVDAWDIGGPGRDMLDPGSDPRAPYHTQHRVAEFYENQFAIDLGMTPLEYELYLEKHDGTLMLDGPPVFEDEQ